MVRKVAYTVKLISIRMTEKFPSRFEEQKMPILNIKLSVHECVLKQCHYSTPMASKSVIMVS